MKVLRPHTLSKHSREILTWARWLDASARRSDRITISARFAEALARELRAQLERDRAA